MSNFFLKNFIREHCVCKCYHVPFFVLSVFSFCLSMMQVNFFPRDERILEVELCIQSTGFLKVLVEERNEVCKSERRC